LGIDPGSLYTGYGLVSQKAGKITLIKADRLVLNPDWPLFNRMASIFRSISEVIETYRPTVMALEDVFTYKNPNSALKLAQARAAAVLPAALAELPIYQYAPQLVKLAVASSGRAEKSQVAFMVGKILSIDYPLSADASDALAVAICHCGQENLPNSGPMSLASASAGRGRGSSWRRLSESDLKNLGLRLENKL
jgi:crossover junction endodeoxyribonuclease RuvC